MEQTRHPVLGIHFQILKQYWKIQGLSLKTYPKSGEELITSEEHSFLDIMTLTRQKFQT